MNFVSSPALIEKSLQLMTARLDDWVTTTVAEFGAAMFAAPATTVPFFGFAPARKGTMIAPRPRTRRAF